MKAGTHNHLKVKRLKRLLGIPLYRAVGILETLWLLAIDCADEGDIGKFTDEEIADYLEWDGSASDLVRALSDSGWTDPDNDGRPVIHDWLEHCPEFIRDRVRKRDARGAKKPKRPAAPNKQTTYGQSAPDISGQSRTDTGPAAACPVYGNSIPTNSIPTNAIVEVCTETPEASSAPPSPRAKAVLEFPCDGKEKTFRLYQHKLDEYRESFPSLDVPGEFRKALQWIRDNPSKRKTAQGMPGFLTRWLGKAQNLGGRSPLAAVPERHSVDLANLDLDSP